MKIHILYNRRSGSFSEKEKPEIKLKEIFRAHLNKDVDILLFRLEKKLFTQRLTEAFSNNPDVVIVAGGDGTISAAAAMAVKTNTVLGVLPKGTYNNFSKDLGIPQKTDEALKVIALGSVKAIDVAEVNGHIFINNSSVGIYPNSVRVRKQRQYWWGHKKKRAMLRAILKMFYKFPLYNIGLDTEKYSDPVLTPFVFIGNNSYSFSIKSVGTRDSLVAGKLSLFYIKGTNRISFLLSLIMSLFGIEELNRNFVNIEIENVTLSIAKKKIDVSADGEILELIPPLQYKILPKALKILLPSEDAV